MSDPLKLTIKRYKSVQNSEVGQYLNRLIEHYVSQDRNWAISGAGGDIIQRLWVAFHPGEEVSFEYEE